MPDFKVKFPSPTAHGPRNPKPNPLPPKFFAVGWVGTQISGGTVKKLSASVAKLPAGATAACVVLELGGRRRTAQRLPWVALTKISGLPAGGPYTVQMNFEATVVENPAPIRFDPFELVVAQRAFDVIETHWPEDGYTVEGDERSVFLCFGESTLPVTNVTLDGESASDFSWYMGDGSWWAEFDNLGTVLGEGNDYPLVATDTATAASAPVKVNIAAS